MQKEEVVLLVKIEGNPFNKQYEQHRPKPRFDESLALEGTRKVIYHHSQELSPVLMC